MRKPDMKIESSNHSRPYESSRHLEFGPEIPKAAPLANPTGFIAGLATAITEVVAGIRSVDQLSKVLNEHVYESLRLRAAARSQLRLTQKKKPLIQPTDVVRVRYQQPAEDVIESVIVLSTKQRAKAVTIRLEGQSGSWRATNIGFL